MCKLDFTKDANIDFFILKTSKNLQIVYIKYISNIL